MNPETLFPWAGRLALVGWLLLIVAPRWRWSAGLVAKFVVPLLLAGVYLGIFAAHLGEFRGSFNSLAGVAELFANPWALLAGWVHYLAFDLFVGAWEVRDAARERIRHRFVAPCLVLTFLLGPIGFLLYAAVRGAHRLARRGRPAISTST